MLGNRGSSTSDLLALVLGLLHGLTGSLLLLRDSVTYKTVFRLKLSHGILVIVNQTKASRLAATKLGSETKQDSKLGIGLVHASYNFLELLFRNIRATRVDDIHDHLLVAIGRDSKRDGGVRNTIQDEKNSTGMGFESIRICNP